MIDYLDPKWTPQFDPNELARDREDFEAAWINELWPILRPGIWHVTGSEGLRGILNTGAIKPNTGTRPYSFPQSAGSYALAENCVALFDFGAVSEEHCIYMHFKWLTFFRHWSPISVALGLHRETLAAGYRPNYVARLKSPQTMWIPGVEAWHYGPIPLDAIRTAVSIEKRTTAWTVHGPDELEALVALDG